MADCSAAPYAGIIFPPDTDLQSYNGTGILEIEGTLSRNPENTPKSTRLYLSASSLRENGRWRDVSGTVLIFTNRYPEYKYGDRLILHGILQDPKVKVDADYATFLAQQGIYSTMSYPQITVAGQGGSPLLRWLHTTRDAIAGTLARILPEPQASLAQGITLGMRGNIPTSLKEDFARTGTTHLLAISGINLTIVAGILVSAALKLFGRRYHIHIFLTLAIILIYAWLTGLQPPVLRATVMLAFFLGADLFGRQKSTIIALLLAACLMSLFDPDVLREASFQLSFLAMTGLIFIASPLQNAVQNRLDRLTDNRNVAALLNIVSSGFIASLGATITTWPLVAYYFGIYSWIGPLATVITIPVLPAIILTSILSGTIGLFLLPIGQFIGWAAWFPLSYLITAVTALARFPGISFGLHDLSVIYILLYYTLLIVILIWIRRKTWLTVPYKVVMYGFSRVPFKWVATPTAALAIVIWLWIFTIPDENVHISFLNVGQGDAILIEKGSRQILIDGGPEPHATTNALGKKMPFWDRTIDLVVLTHPDNDHLGGLIAILERYHVNTVLAPNVNENSPLYEAWLATISKKPVKSLTATAGHTISLGNDLTITVLNPPPNEHLSARTPVNEFSVVLHVRAGNISFLLTGDLGTTGEQRLIDERIPLKSTVLKVGHHGSTTSTGADFLRAVAPRAAVISVGQGNRFGHPNPEVVQKLERIMGTERIYRTDHHGTIEFITDGTRLWVVTDNP